MAKGNQSADTERTRSRKGAEKEDKSKKSKNKKSNRSNGIDNDNDKDEAELVVPDSSAEEDNEAVVDDSEEDQNGDDKEEEAEGAKSSAVTHQPSKKAKNGDKKGKGALTKINNNKNSKIKNDESAASNRFPVHRITRMIKGEDPNIRITQEAIFLINKASEKFLELFCKEAYAVERKNQVSYKHLSSVVSKRKRLDFLSDFVPDKVKAEDALAEMSVAET